MIDEIKFGHRSRIRHIQRFTAGNYLPDKLEACLIGMSNEACLAMIYLIQIIDASWCMKRKIF